MNWLLDPAPVIRFRSNAESILVAPTQPSPNDVAIFIWQHNEHSPTKVQAVHLFLDLGPPRGRATFDLLWTQRFTAAEICSLG
jgi:hypothetical protein